MAIVAIQLRQILKLRRVVHFTTAITEPINLLLTGISRPSVYLA
jgi:hypothetical protein